MRELIDAHCEEFAALWAKYAATEPVLFGSVARGTARPDSDIDVLVEWVPSTGIS